MSPKAITSKDADNILKKVSYTKRGRLSLLTNGALVYESKSGGSQTMGTAVHITWHGAQINFGYLPPYLTYGQTYTIRRTQLTWGSRHFILSFYPKVWWPHASLFIYFQTWNTCSSPFFFLKYFFWGFFLFLFLSILPHCWSAQWQTALGCRPGIRTRAALQQADALPTELRCPIFTYNVVQAACHSSSIRVEWVLLSVVSMKTECHLIHVLTKCEPEYKSANDSV